MQVLVRLCREVKEAMNEALSARGETTRDDNHMPPSLDLQG